MLDNAADLLLVVLGFGGLIFIHELGHFLAARWAGIRVLTFAIGIGSTVVSFRPGLGWRRGSSEREYLVRVKQDPAQLERLSPTEYTLKWIPLGGFVRMLGQEDLHPERVSAEPDSYQAAPVWKRLVVISAGVIANIILAAMLFVIAFMMGLKSIPATVGGTSPGSPAATAVALGADTLGITQPGLQPGDTILALDGERPLEWGDLVTEIAMAAPSTPVRFTIQRDGYSDPLLFDISPVKDPYSGLLTAGISQPPSLTLAETGLPPERTVTADGQIVAPGSTLIAGGTLDAPAGQTDLPNYGALARLLAETNGQPLQLSYEPPSNTASNDTSATPTSPAVTVVQAQPVLGLMAHDIDPDPQSVLQYPHILGLLPCVTVSHLTEGSAAQGKLQPGDVIVRIGTVEFPDQSTLIAEVQAHRNSAVDVVVLRRTQPDSTTDQGTLSDADRWDRVPLTLDVSAQGMIGFGIQGIMSSPPVLATAPQAMFDRENQPADVNTLAAQISRPGLRVVSINGQPVSTFGEMAVAFRRIAETSPVNPNNPDNSGQDSTTQDGPAQEITVTVELPLRDASGAAAAPVPQTWTLDQASMALLTELEWSLPGTLGAFVAAEVTLQADDPLEAMGMGLHRTKLAMLQVYLTLARITQGTVQIRHLNGPIGIARTGTIIADRGLIWLIFFFGLISVNLAVVNFLPIPILDGGQFLFLIYEWARGKPPPIPVQNALTLAGLVLIGAMFLVVTFNDVRSLLGV